MGDYYSFSDRVLDFPVCFAAIALPRQRPRGRASWQRLSQVHYACINNVNDAAATWTGSKARVSKAPMISHFAKRVVADDILRHL